MAPITLFLCGDVMLGRGIDQVLPYPGGPALHEPYVTDARQYLALAEQANGPIPRPVGFDYVWGDALPELFGAAPDFRLINLETSITTSDSYWKAKEIHYRMNPANISCITAAGIDCCDLANNHVLDWGYAGLAQTLDTLRRAGVKVAGAGLNREEAERPVVMEVKGKGRVIVLALGSQTSGIPKAWAAEDRPGVNLLRDLSGETAGQIGEIVTKVKGQGDVVVVSIHWGPNWGYHIDDDQIGFAHELIGHGVDVIHGHSSHHVKGIEVYRGKPILYGSGDFINDYEGISGCEAFRGDLGLMYFLTIDPAVGELASMRMTPTRIRNFRVNRAARDDARWLAGTLDREGSSLGTAVELGRDDRLMLKW